MWRTRMFLHAVHTSVLQLAGLEVSEPEADALLHHLDSNGDGEVSTMNLALFPIHCACFGHLDMDTCIETDLHT